MKWIRYYKIGGNDNVKELYSIGTPYGWLLYR